MDDLKKILTRALSELDYADEFTQKRTIEDLLRRALKLAKGEVTEGKSLSDRLERMSKRLYSKGKPESKLVNSRKTKIPGFSYHFRRK